MYEKLRQGRQMHKLINSLVLPAKPNTTNTIDIYARGGYKTEQLNGDQAANETHTNG